MTSSSVVTVTIPSYNYAQYLRECVESAARQVGVNVDVVIVENASTDGSVELARQLASEYDCVRIVEHADNLGIITSLNRCRDEVRGDYSVLLCADDCLTPGSLARSVEFLDAHPEVGMTYGPVIDFERHDEITPERLDIPPREPVVYTSLDWIDRCCRDGVNPMHTPEVMMRKSVLDVAGRLDPACPYTSDLNMWLRMAVHADVAYLPGPPLALFRWHDDNYSAAYKSLLGDLEGRWTAFARFLDTVDARPERARWERTVRRSLAREARFVATRAYVQSAGQTPPEETKQLLEFAAALDPRATAAREYAWKLRYRMGPRAASTLFFPRRALGRLERNATARRMLRTGV